MKRSSSVTGVALLTAAAALSTTAAAPPPSSSQSPDPASREHTAQQQKREGPRNISFFSDRPLDADKQIPVKSLPKAARDQLSGRPKAEVKRDTPRGYKLRRGQRTTNFIYNSADVWAIDVSCGWWDCDVTQQVRLQFKENVFGRQSKRWLLRAEAKPWSGPPEFELDYSYECGVNLPNQVDETCSTWHNDGADGPDQGASWDGQQLNRGFGRTPGATKFPMLKLDVEFADGSHARGDDGELGEKFRGWDVCVTQRTTKLCPTTGTGD
ncbi:hypothetical protein [Streptomyces sp. NPDC048172]|uniref:hypothetical protein n=1 Tax=Streptomyces sp. NPDC048172 TaxID=3365505 RepID=UPI00371E3BD3